MNRYDSNNYYPNTLEALDPFINPKSPTALDDIGIAILREKFFEAKDGGGYDAIAVLVSRYGRNIDWMKLEYPKDKSGNNIPRWVWLSGAGILVFWFVTRDNKKKGLTGVLKGKTFDAGNLS
jgi:hypothetical protein